MSKVSFRARQIDFNKPLPIIKNDSDLLSEFNESTLVNRGVPQIPSGMEKEEENEHHFVEVIHALQLRDDSDVKIPVPDIIDRSHFYQQTYPGGFSLPKQLVHIRTTLLAEGNDADYDMDSDDEEWLNKSHLGIEAGKFEAMIDRLEHGCGQQVMNLEEAKCLLKEDPSLAIAVYDYWLSKRVQCRQPLLYSVRQEKRDSNSNGDPYIAFRRRSEKMQTRKNRKNDEQSYEKMLTLRNQMEVLGEILSRLVKREAVKHSLLHCEQRCFDTRYKLGDWDGCHLAEAEILARKPVRLSQPAAESQTSKTTCKRSARKRKLTQRALDLSVRTQSSEDISDTERCLQGDEPFAFLRMQGCRYLKPRNAADVEDSLKAHHPHLRYSLTTVPVVCHPIQRTYTGYIRRRFGRGGRIVCDRLQAPVDLSYLSDQNRQLLTNVAEAVSTNPPYVSRAPNNSFDETLVNRLKPVIFGNHRSRPSLRWPLCTKFPPSSFEALNYSPRKFSRVASPVISSPCNSPVYISEPQPPLMMSSESSTPRLIKANLLNANGLSTSLKDCPQMVFDKETSGTPDHQNHVERLLPKYLLSNAKGTPGGTHACSPLVAEECSASTPHKVWQQLARRYGALDGLRSTELSKSRDPELSKVTANGHPPRLPQQPDDRLLRKESCMFSSKLCCVTRDCVSIDPPISGPQLQTANGMSSSQFCQLPT